LPPPFSPASPKGAKPPAIPRALHGGALFPCKITASTLPPFNLTRQKPRGMLPDTPGPFWCTGTADWCTKSADWCTGTADWCTGTMNWCTGTMNWCTGTMNWCTGITDWCTGTPDWCTETMNWCTGTPDWCTETMDWCGGRARGCRERSPRGGESRDPAPIPPGRRLLRRRPSATPGRGRF
jgi:hypothetical protein